MIYRQSKLLGSQYQSSPDIEKTKLLHNYKTHNDKYYAFENNVDDTKDQTTSIHHTKDVNTPKAASKEFKLNTQKIIFQNFMNDDNNESSYPMSKTNKLKIGTSSNLAEDEEDEIALIEKEMNRIEELNKTNSE